MSNHPDARGTRLETRSIDYVPQNERSGRAADQGPFWFLGNFHFFTITIGFVGPSLGLSWEWTALAGALGIAFGTLFMAFHGSQGPEMGLPQMIQSRGQFGYRGVIVALFATLFVFVGFNVVNVTLMKAGLSRVFGLDPTLIAVVAIIPGTIFAIYGHDLLHKVFKWALIGSLPLYSLVTLAAIFGFIPAVEPAADAVPPGFSWVLFFTQFALAASYNISYAPYVSDYTRYLPHNTSRPALIAAIFIGASLSGAWMIGLGAWLAENLAATDSLVALEAAGSAIATGLGKAVVILAVLTFLPVIGLNAYSAMLTVLTMLDSAVKIEPTAKLRVGTVIAIALVQLAVVLSLPDAALSVLNVFLFVMLYFLVPWTAVNLVDYFFVRHGRYAIPHFFIPNGIYGAWGWQGLLSYLIGFIAMVPFMYLFDTIGQQEIYVGPMAAKLGYVDIAWLVGLLVSGVVYLVLSRTLDLAKEEAVIREIEKSGTFGAPVGKQHAGD